MTKAQAQILKEQGVGVVWTDPNTGKVYSGTIVEIRPRREGEVDQAFCFGTGVEGGSARVFVPFEQLEVDAPSAAKTGVLVD